MVSKAQILNYKKYISQKVVNGYKISKTLNKNYSSSTVWPNLKIYKLNRDNPPKL